MSEIKLSITIEDDIKSDSLETILDRLGFITDVKSFTAFDRGGKLIYSYTKKSE